MDGIPSGERGFRRLSVLTFFAQGLEQAMLADLLRPARFFNDLHSRPANFENSNLPGSFLKEGLQQSRKEENPTPIALQRI